ncbi:MAG TPA: RNA polymerase sigma factor [Candidatus Eisenbacteria bacterium]
MQGSTDPTQKSPATVDRSERPRDPVSAPAGSPAVPGEAPAGAAPAAGPDGGAAGGGAAGRRPAPPPREELERLRARDPEALGAFFERYFDRVYGLVYHLLGERAAAEDATQEVFLKVHRAASQLDASRDPAPWLAAIAYNTCRDIWRSGAYRMRRRSASIEQDPAVAMRLSHGDDPEQAALRTERERLVREAIARLPEPMRAAVLLYDYHGLSHQEIAEAMGVGHAAARKRYSRALAALGNLLREKLG